MRYTTAPVPVADKYPTPTHTPVLETTTEEGNGTATLAAGGGGTGGGGKLYY